MNREIKFRGRTAKGKWVIGGFTLDAAGQPRITTVDSSGEGLEFHVVYPDSVGQFTGMLDAHKVEIFEGDIVKNTVPIYKKKTQGRAVTVTHTGDRSMISTVRWNLQWGCWDLLPEGEHTRNRVEIIGNIHDNPELLETKEVAK